MDLRAQLLSLIAGNQETPQEEPEVKLEQNTNGNDELMKLLAPLLNGKHEGENPNSWKKGLYKVVKPKYGMHMIFSCKDCRTLQYDNKDKYEKEGDVVVFKLPMKQCCIDANMKLTDLLCPPSEGNGQKRKYGEY
jgi:hypothetical protein